MQQSRRLTFFIACTMVTTGLAAGAVSTWHRYTRSLATLSTAHSRLPSGNEIRHAVRIIRGVVRARGRPVAGAKVRIPGTATCCLTDKKGRFHLFASTFSPGAISVSVSKPGYFIRTTKWKSKPISIALRPLPDEDSLSYAWVDPRPNEASQQNCGNCHRQIFDEWQSSGHAVAARNSRFLDLYRGTDANGKSGQGWSFLADYPDGRDVCAACHAPSAGFDRGDNLDMRAFQSSVTEQGTRDDISGLGVHCDFCHKIQSVHKPLNGLAHGRFGIQLLRPRKAQLFFGPWEDANRPDNAFSSLQKSSRLCATCHEGTLFGVPVYTTYSEWLVSPARQAGRECQSCHMPSQGHSNVAPGHGGMDRDPAQVSSHTMMPGGTVTMMRSALHLQARIVRTEQNISCVVDIVTHDVGHKVPTGFIDRHLLLVINARNKNGQGVRLSHGNILPAAAGDLAGQAGRLLGRLAVDTTGQPVPFWKTDTEYQDTRLKPETTERFSWELPPTVAHVAVRLLYRRFWHTVTRSKGWPDETLELCERTLTIAPDE